MNSKQLSAPEKGDIAVIIKTSMGEIKIKMFPDYAPKAVENFITHAKNGYYNGLIFHRVIKDFMIQGGDPNGTGTGGNSIWNKPFEDEFTPQLHNLNGALSMANAGPNTNGSQFFIVKAGSVPENLVEQMKDMPEYFPEEFVKDYSEIGGTPWLDYHHTVFGQVYDGMDVVNSIANVKTDYSDKPETDVIIESIEVINA